LIENNLTFEDKKQVMGFENGGLKFDNN